MAFARDVLCDCLISVYYAMSYCDTYVMLYCKLCYKMFMLGCGSCCDFHAIWYDMHTMLTNYLTIMIYCYTTYVFMKAIFMKNECMTFLIYLCHDLKVWRSHAFLYVTWYFPIIMSMDTYITISMYVMILCRLLSLRLQQLSVG